MGTLAEKFKRRSHEFAVRVIGLYRVLPKTEEARIIGRQLVRSATSVASNYRAVCRSRSRAEFVSKMGIVVEVADETLFWIELLGDANIVPKDRLAGYRQESLELSSIFASSYHTARAGKDRNTKKTPNQ
ncbi:MAG TPA: four helix bundle protein [Bacteroidota bacterium]